MELDVIKTLTQFGTAGLMGVLWVWERSMSRHRETQLSAAHDRLISQREQLRVLLRIVGRNTRAIERFDQTQRQLNHLLEKLHDRMQRETTDVDGAVNVGDVVRLHRAAVGDAADEGGGRGASA